MTPRSIYIYSFHMPLFFFLSGYVHKQKPFRDFLRSKINALYVPYVTFSLFSWLFYLVQHVTHGNAVEVSNHLPKIRSVFTGTADNGGNNPIWFLTCVLVISIIFFLINQYINKPILKWAIIFTLSLIGFSLGTGFNALFQFDVTLTGLVFYSLGHTVRKINLLNYLDGMRFYKLIVCLFLCELTHILSAYSNVEIAPIHWVNMAGNVLGNYGLFYISSLSGITVFLIIGYKLRYIKLLNYLGLHTLAILGFHKPVLQILEHLSAPISASHAWLYGILASVAAISFSLLLGYLLNKVAPTLLGQKPLIPRLSQKTDEKFAL